MKLIPFFLQYLSYFKLYPLLLQTLIFIHHPSHTTSTYHVVIYTVHFLSLSYFQLVYHVTILPDTRSQSIHPTLCHYPPPPTPVFPFATYGKWGNTSPVLSSRGLI